MILSQRYCTKISELTWKNCLAVFIKDKTCEKESTRSSSNNWSKTFLISVDFDDFTSVYSSIFVSIEKIYQTIKTVFHRLSTHLEFRQNTPLRAVFTSTLCSVFGILMKHCLSCLMYYFIFFLWDCIYWVVVLLYFHAGCWIAVTRYMSCESGLTGKKDNHPRFSIEVE